jgi:type IV secretory pathway VirB10-like protein
MSDDLKSAFEDSPSNPQQGNLSKKNQNKIILILLGVVFVFFAIFLFGNFGAPKKTAQKTSKGPRAEYASLQQPAAYAANIPDNNVNEKVNALQQENEEIRNTLDMIQKQNQAMYEDLQSRASISGSSGGGSAPINTIARPSSIEERFSADYQSKVQHFKANKENYWQISDDQLSQLRNQYAFTAVEASAEDIYQSPNAAGAFSYQIPAGTRIIAITEQPVNTDHPGYFTSRIIRPYIIKDAKLICQSGANQNDRIPVMPVKIVFNNKEIAIAGQAEMNFPGLSGKVTNHWPSRLLPTMINSAIAGSFIAWGASQDNTTRINTQDAITASVVDQTVPGIQNEIARFGGDKPNTVEVPQGTQFAILLTDKLEVR